MSCVKNIKIYILFRIKHKKYKQNAFDLISRGGKFRPKPDGLSPLLLSEINQAQFQNPSKFKTLGQAHCLNEPCPPLPNSSRVVAEPCIHQPKSSHDSTKTNLS